MHYWPSRTIGQTTSPHHPRLPDEDETYLASLYAPYIINSKQRHPTLRFSQLVIEAGVSFYSTHGALSTHNNK
jgi:hypothetical protein